MSDSDIIETVSVTDDGGIVKEILRAGTGDEYPPPGSKVIVHYVGTLKDDGSKFDSSRDRDAPFDFQIGVGHVIKGWDLGVATMKKGELANIICTADYGYGARGSPPKIPGGATLKFEVELLDFNDRQDLTGGGGVEKSVLSASKAPAFLASVDAALAAQGAPAVGDVAPQPSSGLTFGTPNDEANVTVSFVASYLDADENPVAFQAAKGLQAVLGDDDGAYFPSGFVTAVKSMKLGEYGRFWMTAATHGFGAAGWKAPADAGAAAAPVAIADVPAGAKLVYEVVLHGFARSKDARDCSSAENQSAAEAQREAAKKLFVAGSYAAASARYEKAIGRLEAIAENGGDADAAATAKALASLTFSNIALCQTKLEAWPTVIAKASKAIEADPNNAKAFVLRGKAKMLGLKDLDAAKADFVAVAGLADVAASVAADAAKNAKLCTAQVKAARKKQGEALASAFSSGAKKSNKKKKKKGKK